MVTIIFKNTTPIEVAGKILSKFGYFDGLKIDENYEFLGYFNCYNEDLIHDYYKEKLNRGYHYGIKIIISGFSKKDALFRYEPAYSYAYCSCNDEKYESCLKLRESILKFCKENKIKTEIFEKYDKIDKVINHISLTLQKLYKIGFLENDHSNDIQLIKEKVKSDYDNYCADWYDPLKYGYSRILYNVYLFFKDKVVYRDFYEYPWTSPILYPKNDSVEIMKKDYEKLINDLLKITNIDLEKINIKIIPFDEDENEIPAKVKILIQTKKDKRELIIEHHECVSLNEIISFLNYFIRKLNMNEKRSLQTLQIVNDQTGCVWFITDNEKQKLCEILHRYWPGHHICEVTGKNFPLKNKIDEIMDNLIYSFPERL